MIPLSDDLPTLRTPVVTYALIAVTAAVWVLVQGAGFNEFELVKSVCNLGLVPGELTHRAALGTGVTVARDPATGRSIQCIVDNDPVNILTPVISMFLHGSWGHILGNMLFFWVFGNNVEDSMGRGRFFAFYILCGLAAAAAHILVSPSSPIPTVGASGAISGVMGAYLLLYPRARVNMLFIFVIFIRIIPVQAWLVLVWWFVVQVLTGLPELSPMRPEVSGGVAVWAHVGGFLAGLVLINVFADPRLVAAHKAAYGDRLGRAWRPFR